MINLNLLRPHQVQPVHDLTTIFKIYDSACDLSDTGTGKTFVGAAVAATLRLPTLVVAPKISLTNWHEVASVFGEKNSVISYEALRSGNSMFGLWANQEQVRNGRSTVFVCTICQRRFDPAKINNDCPHHQKGFHCVESKKLPIEYGQFSFYPGVRFIIFDEAHRMGALDSLNADILIAAKRQKIKHLLLSATLAQSPLGMRALGFSLDLHNDKTDRFTITRETIPNFFRWSARFGVRREPGRGLQWRVGAEKQKEVMAEIHSQIIPARGVRVTTDSIPNFPIREIEANTYDLDEAKAIDGLYGTISEAMDTLAERRSTDDPENPLTKVLRARQEIELLKTKIFIELAQDALEKNQSVVVFVNFKQTLEILSKALRAPVISGEVTGEKRATVISDFQSNKISCVIVQCASGGISISLHDLDGKHPRIGLVSPSFSAVELKQILGRLHREGGRSRCFYRLIFAAGTVETKIQKAIKQKLSNLDSINDGDLMLSQSGD